MNSVTKIMEQQCPLCGENSSCAISLGQPIEQCWCNSVAISDTTLDKIPESQIRQRCLCQACAANAGEPDLGR